LLPLSFLSSFLAKYDKGAITFYPFVITFSYLLSLVLIGAPFKGKAPHVYSSSPLEKVKNQYGCLRRFLFGFVGLQWIEKGN
jgi:hypothetical protein